MIPGLKQSAIGLTQRAAAQEVYTNNLANINTPGFRADRVSFVQVLGDIVKTGRAVASAATRPLESGSGLSRPVAGSAVAVTTIDLTQGPVETTGNDLDFAVDGAGFFAVQTPQGERYTRGGAFTLDGEGKLVTRSGHPVLSDGGPITVDQGKLMVGPDGSIAVNGETTAKMRLVTFANPRALTRTADGLFRSALPPQEVEGGRILQGSLEGSNVNPVTTLTEMMMALREFEANQRAAKTQDETAEKLITESGR